jgi:putative flippase GtrA
MNKHRLIAILVVTLVALAMAAGFIWLLWRGMLLVPPNAARVWALVATALLPIVGRAGWWFGHSEARGRLAGIDQGVDRMMGALARAAGLQVSTARAIHRPVAQEPPVVVLPDVEIVQRQLHRGEDVIEL